jgi:hypothetical protein
MLIVKRGMDDVAWTDKGVPRNLTNKEVLQIFLWPIFLVYGIIRRRKKEK